MSRLYDKYYKGKLLRPQFNSDEEYWNYINEVDNKELTNKKDKI